MYILVESLLMMLKISNDIFELTFGGTNMTLKWDYPYDIDTKLFPVL